MHLTYICILGIGTVFIGLICIIALVYLMSAICKLFGSDEKAASTQGINPAQKPRSGSSVASSGAPIANKQEIVAGVCAVIAEELGTDVKNIRVVSFKRA